MNTDENGKPTEEETDNYYEEEFWIQTDWDRKPVTPITWVKPSQTETEEN